MTRDELDVFFDQERTLRLATVDDDGWPTVAPVWFVWFDGEFWVRNLDRARRTARLEAGGKTSVSLDAGDAYLELRGIAARVHQHFLRDDQVPVAVRIKFSQRYAGTDEPVPAVADHTWLRLAPKKIRSWDFRKIAAVSAGE
jgi:hypothetical protein